MRRLFAALLAAIVLGMVPAAALAATDPASDWTYAVKEDGVEITGYKGDDTDIAVPPEIDGMPVTRIGQGAFRNGAMRSIAIPDSVTYIATYAFDHATSLEEVRLPSSASYLGASAFLGCSSLREVVVPRGVSGINSSTFQGCEALKRVVLPYGLEWISPYAFTSCHSLGATTVPETVTEVGKSSLGGCGSLTVIYGGSEEEWNSWRISTDAPLTTRVWCTDKLDFDVRLAGPAGPLAPGQTVEIQVSCDDEIPSWAQLDVELELDGLESGTCQATLTADRKSAALTATVAEDTQAASAQVVAAGGRAVAASPWSAPVISSQSTRYETAPIGTASAYTSVGDLLAQWQLPAGATINVLNQDGATRDNDLPLATGNLIRIQYPDGSTQTLETVVKGDVLGTGLLGLDQLARMASALGGEALDELPGAAADLNGNGGLDLSDLVLLAKQYKAAVSR